MYLWFDQKGIKPNLSFEKVENIQQTSVSTIESDEDTQKNITPSSQLIVEAPTNQPRQIFFDDFQDGRADGWESPAGSWLVIEDTQGKFVYQGEANRNEWGYTYPVSENGISPMIFFINWKIIPGGIF